MDSKPSIYSIIILINALLSLGLEVKPESFTRNEAICKQFARDPYFDIDLVVGKPWRIYYTWNMQLDAKCLDMVFKNATKSIINRIWSDMGEYIEQQPNWESASMLLAVGTAQHEMLLIPDQGAEGNFLGVPNVVRDGNITPMKRHIPLLKFHIKLVREGKFLVMADCHIGVASLGARGDEPPYRSEILAATSTLDLGDGFPACTKNKNVNEQFLIN